jgi:beta-glucosidase
VLSGELLKEPITIEARVTNTGRLAGDEVVQAYVTDLDAPGATPIRSLKAFCRVALEPGETKPVVLTIPPQWLVRVSEEGREEIAPGRYRISLGGGQPTGDNADKCLIGNIERK